MRRCSILNLGCKAASRFNALRTTRSTLHSHGCIGFSEDDANPRQRRSNFWTASLFADAEYLLRFSKNRNTSMRNMILSVVVGLGTLASMAAAETQQQPEVGKPAPDFSLTTGDGSQVSLKDYHGKWVVLYFYPKDFTSGCRLEGRNFLGALAS